jgi:hypothetical protein
MAIDALVRLHRWWRWLLAGGSDSLNMRGLEGCTHLVQGTLMRCPLHIGGAMAIMLIYSILPNYDVAGLRTGVGKEEGE